MKLTTLACEFGFFAVAASVLLVLAAIVGPTLETSIVITIIFGSMTVALSYAALQYSKEKFRLDLFEKRWEVYEHTLEFCSRVTQQGSLVMRNDNEAAILAALKAAEQSFRGTGWHKTRALFDRDISELFDEINKSYAWLTAFSDQPPQHRDADWPQKMHDNIMFMWNTVGKLPEVFKPYIYFGDYRR